MAMSLNDIRESGLLELYVMGTTDADENKLVEDAIANHPELKHDILDIEKALKVYAHSQAVIPPAFIKTNLLNAIGNSSVITNSSHKALPKNKSFFNLGHILLTLLSLALFAWMSQLNKQHKNQVTGLENQLATCDSLTQSQSEKIKLLDQINAPNNSIIPIDPTEKYPETKLFFHLNNDTKQNLIQIKNLPALASNQSFQLWSLKGDNPPIPLDVFQGDKNALLKVKFVDGTNAYAITIEPKGGSQSPTLENLIGVFSV